ncbi:unnamed protein product [Meganyctiphanes norvegica]|uniref:Uncharacterized protein n=1 Tax=Meganyctiphanes norvegica TaxID=48144 RepID=A0AAV2RIR8_MEGNR
MIMDLKLTTRQKIKICCIVFGFIFSILPIVFGSIYTDCCPVEPMIPIWCIVYGSAMILACFLELSILLRDVLWKTAMIVRGVIYPFKVIWIIVGCVYTYRNNEPSYNPEDAQKYCHKLLYQFAFWFLTSHFILALVIIFCASIIYPIFRTSATLSKNANHVLFSK